MAIERNAAAEAAAAAAGGDQPPATPVRVITLNHGEHQDSTLYRMEKGFYLQFYPGPSLLGRKVFLYTNYVMNDSEDEKSDQAEFIRNQYYGLEWYRSDPELEGGAGADGGEGERLGTGAVLMDTDVYCEIKLARAGAYHYYFVYENAESTVGPQGSGWFHVAPTLRVGGPGAGAETIPLDGVLCHTVLAKCLGPLTRWEGVLRVAKETGYNMIHFTPIQELGGSDSSYSIANQLRVDPRYGAAGRDVSFGDVDNVLARVRAHWKMASISDVVLNHTANETPWLVEHPEASYNCANCPHLRPAALLDALLAKLTDDVARGDYAPRGVPCAVSQPQHLEAIKQLLLEQLLPEARLHEMFMCNVQDIVQEFYYTARNKVPPVKAPAEGERGELKLIPDPQYRRLSATVDMDLVVQTYNVYRSDCYDEEARLKKCSEELKRKLEQLNEAAAEVARGHLRAAVDNCIAGMSYYRLQSDGPKIEEVSAKNPLVPRYFTYPADVGSVSEMEALVFGAQGARVMAHNGWVMDADPLQDFAAKGAAGRVYLRRELIAWGDSVKLRYGERPEDSPFLWAHMREYVELTAELFDGLRLDNCHSTPLHVAEYLLDCARNVKPDLYVVAELFTNSDSVDNIFVNRLGITSLIREALSAWDCHEQGRLVHRFAGRSVGALALPPRRAAPPAVAHALLLDLTHDNPSPLDRRCVWDTVPSAGIVAMACCATGSTRGYDELVPHHIHVVDESRLYAEWSDAAGADGYGEGKVGRDTGIIAVKKALNQLHYELAVNGYSEVYVDQMNADVVAITRHEPRTRKSVILVAYSAFSSPEPSGGGPRELPPLRFEGRLEELVLEASVVHRDHRNGQPYRKLSSFSKHAQYINGVTECEVSVRQNIPVGQSRVVSGERAEGALTAVELGGLAPGALVALRVAPHAPAAAALQQLERQLAPAAARGPSPLALALAPALQDLDLVDFNALLYRCDAEERDCGGGGVYEVPGYGPLVYSGLQGVASLLSELRADGAGDAAGLALGHALCANLRAGDWLVEYTCARLERDSRLAPVAARYRDAYRPVTALPRFLVPTYFDAVTSALYSAVSRAALARLAGWARESSFARALALTSVQLTGAAPSAPLPPPSPALPPPRLPRGALSAGLPHFAVGYMRCWGRDTFIALRGMFLLTGRYQDARAHILSFGACLRHGLVPNLLDGGRSARYNCRDAVWWWLQSIQQYCAEAPQGGALLSEPVARMFPAADGEPAPPGRADQPLHDVIQEALDVHFQGLVFRERNAGRTIDAHMTDKGFNIQIGIDPETGFPFGGNDANCGTWMDKMGSSDVAGNRGKPATPRDGSAVELVGLAYSAVRWLGEMHRAGRYPYGGVVRRHRDGSVTTWQYTHWAERIRRSFERHFWVPAAPSAADARPDLVHRRAIYKDSHGASQPWADYQLRCNFPVAMVVAPDLFDPRHAWLALDQLEKLLLGPLGVKTLDPADWAYRPNYDNSNNSDDPTVAHGFNYHQGPEWVWPIGYYLRARLLFAHENNQHARTVSGVCAALGPHLAELRAGAWRGLPELTNAGGAVCGDSCRTQAWSSASVLEVLYALREERRAKPLGAA